MVHGDGDHGFLAYLITIARARGCTGSRSRTARPAHGITRWTKRACCFREVAGVIGRRLDVPVVGIASEDAPGHFGWFAQFAGRGSMASSEKTRAALGWQPRKPGLIADLDRGELFRSLI